MDFEDQILSLSKRCNEQKEKCIDNEAATKLSLINPFIRALGYDTENLDEVSPEYNASIGEHKDARVDYAILKDGKPIIIIEAKAYGVTLDAKKCSQLLLYFAGVNPEIGILTDGVTYQFFTKEADSEKMDTRPFMVLNLDKPDPILINELKNITKEQFDHNNVLNAADELRYNREFKQILDKQFKEEPEADFLRFFLSHTNADNEKCFDGVITKKVIEKFTPVLARALNQYLKKRFQDWLDNAMNDGNKLENQPEEQPAAAQTEQPKEDNNGVITTEDELQAYFILKSIAGELVPINDIVMKDYKQFCNFYYKLCLNKSLLLRLYFNEKPYSIELYDQAEPEKIDVDSPQDLFKFKQRLINRIKMLMETK